MKLFKTGAKWNVDNHLVDAGTCYGVLNQNDTYLAIKLQGTDQQICWGAVTNYENEAGVKYTSQQLFTLLDEFLIKTDSEGVTDTLSQVPVRLSGTLTRPANTLDYAANDAVNTATAAVKQKETMTISGAIAVKQKNIVTLTNGAAVKQKQTISFSGTAPTKQKETVTISGSSGTFNVTAAGNLTKLATYHTSPTVTASDFVTAHEAAYLEQNIVVTSDGPDLIFESYAIGQDFVAPVIAALTGDLAGAVVHTTASVKTSTLNIDNGNVGFEVLIDDAIATALATFVTNNDTSFLGYGIVLTSDGADLILEAETAGTGFVEFTTTTTSGNITATSATTQANVPEGTGMLGLPSTLMLPVVYDTDLGTTAAAFASDHTAAFDLLGVAVTASTTTVIFEAKVAGVAYEKPVFQNTAGTLAGAVADTQANVVAGQASISCNGVTSVSTFVTDATTTAAAFVTANSAAYSAAGVALTSSGADLIFEASAAGTAITVPTITQLVGTYTGTVAHTTANASIAALEITGFAKANGGGGYISDVIVETDIVQLASTTQRLWLFNALPSGSVGDNVAFVNSWANRSKRVGYIDVEMGALLVGSSSIIGQVTSYVLFQCATTSTSLFLLHQTLGAATAPKSAGTFNYTFNVLQL